MTTTCRTLNVFLRLFNLVVFEEKIYHANFSSFNCPDLALTKMFDFTIALTGYKPNAYLKRIIC